MASVELPAFGMAGVALGALGRLWWRAWSPLVARGAVALRVALAWQAWQAWLLLKSTFVLRGRRGTWLRLRQAGSQLSPNCMLGSTLGASALKQLLLACLSLSIPQLCAAGY